MLIYIAIIATITCVAVVADAVMHFPGKLEAFKRMRTDRKVQDAKEQEEADRFNEGVENIMSFAVNGKTGFEDQE